MNQDEYFDVILLTDITTDEGTTLKEGESGVLVETFGPSYVVEFAIPDHTLVGGHRFETVVLNPEDFAITGKTDILIDSCLQQGIVGRTKEDTE